jgi:two-component system chemotaxis response regulator CheY
VRVLVVDDEPGTAALLAALLLPLGTAEIADTGARACAAVDAALAEGRPYALICLDVQLGDLDGHAVLAALRAQEDARGVDPEQRARVIMTTVVTEPERMLAAFEGRCDAYVIKPITRARLFAKLRDLGLVPAWTA